MINERQELSFDQLDGVSGGADVLIGELKSQVRVVDAAVSIDVGSILSAVISGLKEAKSHADSHARYGR